MDETFSQEELERIIREQLQSNDHLLNDMRRFRDGTLRPNITAEAISLGHVTYNGERINIGIQGLEMERENETIQVNQPSRVTERHRDFLNEMTYADFEDEQRFQDQLRRDADRIANMSQEVFETPIRNGFGIGARARGRTRFSMDSDGSISTSFFTELVQKDIEAQIDAHNKIMKENEDLRKFIEGRSSFDIYQMLGYLDTSGHVPIFKTCPICLRDDSLVHGYDVDNSYIYERSHHNYHPAGRKNHWERTKQKRRTYQYTCTCENCSYKLLDYQGKDKRMMSPTTTNENIVRDHNRYLLYVVVEHPAYDKSTAYSILKDQAQEEAYTDHPLSRVFSSRSKRCVVNIFSMDLRNELHRFLLDHQPKQAIPVPKISL